MFTVAQKLDAQWISMSAIVLSSSRYGLEYDRVKVLHEVGLAAQLVEDENFYIPPAGRIVDTRTVFPDGNIVNFAGQRFKDLQDELQQYLDAVKTGNAAQMEEMHKLLMSTTMLSPVLFRAGTQVLTFEYELALHANAESVFELSLWAPMPSFNVTGQVTASIQLPSNNSIGSRAQILEARGFHADAQGNVTGNEVTKVLDNSVGLRHIVAWNWQADPLFKVRYQYQ